MSKKIMKRSLALGALMAFVITGSAMAGELNVETNDKEVIYTFKSTYAYPVDDNTVLTGKSLVIKDTEDVNQNIGLLVKDNSKLEGVTSVSIIAAGNKTGLVIDQDVKNVNVTAPITLSGTGSDARIELYSGAEFSASKITSNAEKALLQINGVGEIKVDELIVESGAVNMQANGANDGYTGETGTITYNLNKITVADGASLRAVAWQNGQPNIDITGNLNIDLGANATVDFGGYTNSDWYDTKVNVKSDTMTINVEDANNAGVVYISKDSLIVERLGSITVVSKAENNTGDANADLGKIADVVKINEKEAYTSGLETGENSKQESAVGVKLTQEASSIFDAASGTVSADGTAENIQTTKNSNVFGITENNALSLMSWRAEMNDMNKRMGELRNAEGQHGVWVRMVRGEAEYESVKNQYNQYQMGYDEKLSVDPSWTVGAAFNYTEGDTAYSTGSAENKNVGFSIYGSKLNDDGSFIDLIAKYARLENDFEITNGNGMDNGDYSSNGYSVSAEYGKRFTKENGLWIEPQVELTYGKVGSANYKMGTVDVAQDSIESLVGRVGFSLGKNISKGNVYARASYLYDFDGETAATFRDGADSRTLENDLGGGWWEVGVGANINLSKATYIYADVEKTFGGEVDTNWQWNLGVRYSF